MSQSVLVIVQNWPRKPVIENCRLRELVRPDLFPNEQNFDLDKSRQKFYNRLKEHHKISNIPKFCCEML